MGLEKDGYKTKLWENDVNLWELNGFEPARTSGFDGIKQNGIGQVISMMGQQLHHILRIDDRRI